MGGPSSKFEQDLDKFGGTAKHRIHYDEEPPRNIRQEGKMRLLDYEGADELFTMTPFSGMGWMFDEIWEPWQKGVLEDGKVVVVEVIVKAEYDDTIARSMIRTTSSGTSLTLKSMP